MGKKLPSNVISSQIKPKKSSASTDKVSKDKTKSARKNKQ